MVHGWQMPRLSPLNIQESSLHEIKEKYTGSFTFTASFKWIEKETFIEKRLILQK